MSVQATISELAYAAGVIDSDGTIGIRQNTYSMRVRGDSSAPTYAVRIKVKQVQPEAVQLLKRIFGGALRLDKPQTPKSKPLHSWEIRDMLAEGMLNAILPYLRIKRMQADNCLALRALVAESKRSRVAKGRGHAGAAPRSDEMTAAMHELFLRAKALNMVGVQT